MHDKATRLRAKGLYRQGWTIKAIAAEVEASEKSVRLWRDAEMWAVELKPEQVLDARITHLINQGEKSEAEWQELERLTGVLTKLERGKARAAARANAAQVQELEPAAKRKKPRKNEIGHIDFSEVEGPPLFDYQREIAELDARFIFWIKSRQVGATTHVISWRSLKRAITTGYNQIFLSASMRQVQVFNQSIRKMAAEHLGIELKGSKERIQLFKDGQPWAAFIFLSTNTYTAQSESGDLYIDEVCHIPQFDKLEPVASGMAALKRYNKFYCSSVSTVTHPAWARWEGEKDAKGNRKKDGITRILTDIHDAIKGGNDLIDLEELKLDHTEEVFNQLFLCIPVDDQQSVFRLKQLERCQSDPERWAPADGARAWIGYDPSRKRDFACLCVVALMGEKLRLVHRENWKNKSFPWQAQRILRIAEGYNVEGVGIDTTGMGIGVYDEVKAIGLPGAKLKAITYNLDVKVGLVLNMKRVVDEDRWEYEAGDQLVTASFLAIKQVGTEGGRVTYKAGRSAETGHAEIFWAATHAVSFDKGRRRRRFKFAASA